MVKIFVNDIEKEVPAGITIIQALDYENVQVPRFCYHDKLKIAGNCRMCLVEIVGIPKPQASCALNVTEGMKINTESEMVKKAREGAMEFLLINHPLDCPICDQAGECDLQDQAFIYGKDKTRLQEEKRAVEEKSMGPFIKTQMTRCIHCTRCVRFMEDIAGTNEIGAFGRGNEMEIATFLNENIKSELSGNIIDLCPVGALTAKPYALSYRAWELKKTNSIDVFDSLGSAISVQSKNNEVVRILPRVNEEINEEWLSDKSRFTYDGLLIQRLDRCYIKNDSGKLISTSFENAITHIKSNLEKINLSKEFAAITGFFTDAETTFALKDFMNQIGSPYTESRLKPYNLDFSKRENYLFNSKIAGIEVADFLLIVNSDVSKEAPVLNARIRRNIIERKIPVYYIGQEIKLNFPHTYLGSDIANLTKISSLCKELEVAKKPMVIAGMDAFNGDNGLEIHQHLLELSAKYFSKEDWNGLNILHKSSASVASFDAKFIYSGGINEILSKVQNSEIKALYLLGSDEIDISKINSKTFIIYQGSHGDKLAKFANVILPSTAYTEKSASYINTEGRIQKTNIAVQPIGEALNDVEIVNKIANAFGFTANSEMIFHKFTYTIPFAKDKNIEGKFTLNTGNFYTSDYISRNSVNMQKGEKELS